MKQLLHTLLFTCFFSFSQGQIAERDAIGKAMSAGNSQDLGEYFDKSLDLTLIDSEEVYSKEQAKIILSRFFSERVPSKFELKHEGQSKLQDHYFIGDLITDKGVYRVTYFLKREDDSSFKMKQLRIEE